eukprot:scaffold25973_cov78-Skeletonema_dohrnii-CCMP3373.AAC.1
MANYNGSLKAVDRHIHTVRYDIVLESRAGGRLRWPHQVTYDVVATPIRPKNALAVKKMLLYYHGQLQWVTKSR